MFTKKYFLTGLTIFVLLQVFFYAFLLAFHQSVPLNKDNYVNLSHHYYPDPRMENKNFNLINALGAWDGQWYLRIANAGYPTGTEINSHPDPHYLGGLAYAFFPVYPILIAIFDVFIRNTEITAFILSNILLLANFFSLYYVVSKLYSHEIAMKTNFLLFLFPLSIFYRGYYPEGLFLLLLIWFVYALIKRQWLLAIIYLALLCQTKANGIFLYLPLLYTVYKAIKEKKLAYYKAAAVLILPVVPFVGWYVFNKAMVNDWNYWILAHHVWFQSTSFFGTMRENLLSIVDFFGLPMHSFHVSQSEIVTFFVCLFVVYKSRKHMRRELWLTMLGLCVLPLIIKDFTSYGRYPIVAFPLFTYLATKLKGKWYEAVVSVFLVLLLTISLYFINYAWIE